MSAELIPTISLSIGVIGLFPWQIQRWSDARQPVNFFVARGETSAGRLFGFTLQNPAQVAAYKPTFYVNGGRRMCGRRPHKPWWPSEIHTFLRLDPISKGMLDHPHFRHEVRCLHQFLLRTSARNDDVQHCRFIPECL